MSENGSPRGRDIAIVGLSCLFPGSDGLDAFWRTILEKRAQIVEPVPEWGADRHQPAGRVSTIAGGFLRELYRFDPGSAGVMPSSIDGGEPDQFLALRLAREALDDAGYLDTGHDHTRTGIILGHSTYLHRGQGNIVQHGVVVDQTIALLRQLVPGMDEGAADQVRAALVERLPPFNADVVPGLVPNVLTGRIANRLDFRGPNYTLDAACASSLLAVGAAIEELRTGRSDLMLAGGVNAAIPAEVYMIFTQLGALSTSSEVRPFDAGANGTLLGEGLGILALKRLDDALRDGDRVYAVLKGVGQSSDGKALGLLAPRLEGEVLAFERAYEEARVDPGSVGLVEAHGTGIPKGDQTEIAALARVLGPRGEGLPRCAIGSVKSLIAHCIPAAGAAGLIKAALALHYKVLPPTLCDTVNPELGMEGTPLYVNTEARPWIHGGAEPRRAAVNAFGFGGVNSHAVLEEAPAEAAPHSARQRIWPWELVVLSGETREALLARVDALSAALAEGGIGAATLAEVAAAAARSAGSGERLAIVASDLDDLAAKLARARDKLAEADRTRLQTRNGIHFSSRPLEGRVAFVFPGEGAQYQGMLCDVLMAFPEARDWFDFWDQIFADSRAERPSEVVFPPPTTLDEATRTALAETLFGIQLGSESMFIASQAMLAVLARVGFRADALVGHSSGENTALIAGGAVPLADREALGAHIRRLNAMFREIEAAGAVETGSLLTVGAVDRARVKAVAGECGLHLALDNCHHQSVLYGDLAAIEQAARIFREAGGLCSYLPFDRPYHTPLFRPVADLIRRLLDEMEIAPPATPIYSCATAAPMPPEADALRGVAADQWCTTVRFTETVERMHDDGVRFFVEVGPGSNVTGFVEDILKDRESLAVALDNPRKNSLQQMLTGLGRLWAHGCAIDVAALFAGRGLRDVDPGNWAGPPVPRQKALANTLPVVTLDEGTAAALRSAIAGDAGAAPVEPCAGGANGGLAPHREPAMAHATAPAAMPGDTPGRDVASAPAPGGAALPPEGAAGILEDHFSVMQAFLASQDRIVGAMIGGRPAEAPAPLPFLHRPVETGDGRVAYACDLDAAAEPFLQEHILYASEISRTDPGLHGLAVVPMAVSLEMLAEIAAMQAALPVPVRIEKVRAFNWIALDTGSRTLVLSADPAEDAGGEQRVRARIADGEGQPLVEATVVFAEAAPVLGAVLPPLGERRAPVWREDELYTTGMFHGPLFHSIARISAWDQTGLDAEFADVPLDGFLADGGEAGFLLNPALLDSIGHVTAFWIAQSMGTDFSSFPSSIERIELPGARREGTAGLRIGGRLGFERDGEGVPRFLSGRFEALDETGAVLFRAEGWRDVFFTVPNRFYYARFRPLEGLYGEDVSAAIPGLPEDALAWRVPAFPKGLLETADGIWMRVLAHTVLSREEREAFAVLKGGPRRRVDWLFGRIAAKEAARVWIWRVSGVLLYPAEVTIRPTGAGQPTVVFDPGLDLPAPAVSIAHAGGEAFAVAAPPGCAVGCDFEPVERIDAETVAAGGFGEGERRLIGTDRAGVARGWCAKEAAAKCLGTGLNGRPTLFAVSAIAPEDAVVDTPQGRVPVRLGAIDDFVLAVAVL